MLTLSGWTAAPLFPVKQHAGKRYLLDAVGSPFLIVGDAPHSLIVNCTSNEVITYMQNRGSNGYNSLWVQMLAKTYVNGRADGSNENGDTPFTGELFAGIPDFSTPREAYFAFVDFVVRVAATNGLQLFLDTLETGDWSQTAGMNGDSVCRTYGQFLGNRYKNNTNITWILGNDFQDWTDTTRDSAAASIMFGIQDVDTNHLHTVQLDYPVSESLDDSRWWPIVSLNSVYTYYPTYSEVLNAYQRTNFVPVYLIEEHYEYESVGGGVAPEYGVPSVIRRQGYWTIASGGLGGYMSGNYYTWSFASGWAGFLNSPGKDALMTWAAFIRSLPWYNLVPDSGNVVLTAGQNTRVTTGLVSDSKHATAAWVTNGSLAIVYTPTNNTLTIDMSKFSGSVTSRWFDPADASYTTVSGSPHANTGSKDYSTPGNNAGGDGDWVLLLEAAQSGGSPAPSQANIGTLRVGTATWR